MKCEGRLIQKTGITPGNYPYFADKGAADAFFLSKATASFSDYSTTHLEQTSKNGFNVSCVHLNMPFDDTVLCDYISLRNDKASRWIHAIVTSREYVNENTCRLYFTIDYVASYFDTLELKKCFVERTHVIDDFFGDAALGVSANKYLLSEPLSVLSFDRPEIPLLNPYEETNSFFTEGLSEYTLVTSVDKEGFYSEPKILYQAGGSYSGYMYSGTRPAIESILAGYVSKMSKVLTESNSMMSFATSLKFHPIVVAENRSGTPVIYPHDIIFLPVLLNRATIPVIKHAKTYMYFGFAINSGASIHNFGFHTYDNFLESDVYFTGGTAGRAAIRIFDNMERVQNVEVTTPMFPDVSISGAMKEHQYNTPVYDYLNDMLNSGLHKIGINS